jgi:hypothetical protein
MKNRLKRHENKIHAHERIHWSLQVFPELHQLGWVHDESICIRRRYRSFAECGGLVITFLDHFTSLRKENADDVMRMHSVCAPR